MVYDTVTTNSYALSALSSATAYQWQVMTLCDATGINNSSFSGYNLFTTGSCNIALSTSQTNVLCNGASTGAIDLTVNGGTGSYTYSWSNGATTENLSNLSTGTYSVTVNDACGSSASKTVTITQPSSALSVNISTLTNTTVCSGSTVTLFIVGSGNYTYQWSDANNVIAGATSSTYSASVTGDYTLTITNSNGCTATSSAITATIIILSGPSGLSSSNIQLTKATMNWSAVSNSHHYDVRLRAQSTTSWTLMTHITGTSKQRTGLSPTTTYDWQVRSACDNDTSSSSTWSPTQNFTTLTACTKPTNTNVAAITSSSASVNWDALTGAWGYRVQYLKSGAAWNTNIRDTTNTNSLNITGLDPNSTYRWRVQSMCNASGTNKSGWTSFSYFSTLSGSRITTGDSELADNLNIFPNPTRGIFNIVFISDEIDNFEITIVDAFGKLISQENKQEFVGQFTKQLDLSSYPRGIYMVQIRTNDSFVSKRVVLQ